MAKKTATVKKDRKPRRAVVKADKFAELYRTMVSEGKSTKEIATAFERDEQWVCAKACMLRATIKEQCEKLNFTPENLAKALALVPMLSRGGKNVLDILGIKNE